MIVSSECNNLTLLLKKRQLCCRFQIFHLIFWDIYVWKSSVKKKTTQTHGFNHTPETMETLSTTGEMRLEPLLPYSLWFLQPVGASPSSTYLRVPPKNIIHKPLFATSMDSWDSFCCRGSCLVQQQLAILEGTMWRYVDPGGPRNPSPLSQKQTASSQRGKQRAAVSSGPCANSITGTMICQWIPINTHRGSCMCVCLYVCVCLMIWCRPWAAARCRYLQCNKLQHSRYVN